MEEILKRLPEKAKDKKKENRKFFSRLKKRPPKDLDSLMLELHEDEFSRTDCLNCANCCKTTGPLFTQKDIERISRHFRMKPGEFIDTYLRLDEDNDFVLQSVPCPFLGADNYCSIYDKRPKACREYPHTDRKDFYKISSITIRNTAVCPAAYNIVEEMKKRLKN
ncbi:YkgJ family cysteine cluster protein [Pontixanthobacter gangjinensis]|uniref:YkgJ family cysteine cluster protein n=1 Tax=Christiangramia aestuarii TaxID=1028746 RepID=A0A7M3SXS6_9FLAO|nr:YkgJ family cysteine cluster protein [Christiangramia aestuarii]MUP41407.1 YkgJ family cysteine cluster protein [Christiangramia aestuarii]